MTIFFNVIGYHQPDLSIIYRKKLSASDRLKIHVTRVQMTNRGKISAQPHPTLCI